MSVKMFGGFSLFCCINYSLFFLVFCLYTYIHYKIHIYYSLLLLSYCVYEEFDAHSEFINMLCVFVALSFLIKHHPSFQI